MILAPTTLLTLCLIVPTAAPRSEDFRPVVPLAGHWVLAGYGRTPGYVVDAASDLAGGGVSRWLVFSDDEQSSTVKRLVRRGAFATRVATTALLDQSLTYQLLEADGVWLETKPTLLGEDPNFRMLLASVSRRGGVIASCGSASVALTSPRLTEFLHCAFDFPEKLASTTAAPPPAKVGWRVPPETAVVFHHGRRVGAYGKNSVEVRIATTEGWPERRHTLESRDVVDFGDLPGYELDLMAWQRSARDRQLPVFPSATPSPPQLSDGTLVLSGGGGVQSPTWRRFIRAAGGKDARIVCIPSAAEIDPGDEPRSYSARQLREHGCTNVIVLHTDNPRRAHYDSRFLAQLERATGVWIDGGRTYRVMDAYQDTSAHRLMRSVLARGGVVGGSSAGCQVAGEFLLRGDPRTNRRLVFDGYTRGLGFLSGVIIDAHFRQRNRGDALAELVGQHPQYLGIGIDEDTSLVIKGSTATVFGPEAVSFYDARSNSESSVVLREGERYDLVERRALP